jgi:hypothetical protein
MKSPSVTTGGLLPAPTDVIASVSAVTIAARFCWASCFVF